MDQVALHAFRDAELARARHQEPRRLTRFGYKVFAQNDEDGMIAEIFRRIGTQNRTFVEFGVEAGRECNSLWLLMQGWRGLWIEADAEYCRTISKTHAAWLGTGTLALREAFITKTNINGLIGAHLTGEIDLLSIDLDTNDYWIWEAIEAVSPRAVVIEYNASWPPPAAITVPYDEAARWQGSNHFGASLAALARLGARKGYDLVGCSLAGVNAFFVRRDLVGDRFHAPGSAEEHYEPPRYFLSALASGHPPGIGPVVEIGT